eukprot:342587-Chlamydomonas_euryale.AAC.3
MSMCNPFELTIANANFGKGFNKARAPTMCATGRDGPGTHALSTEFKVSRACDFGVAGMGLRTWRLW